MMASRLRGGVTRLTRRAMQDGTPLARTLRNADDLLQAGLIPAGQRDAVARVEARYAVAITPAMRALIAAPDDPIGRQFVPDPAELATAAA